MHLAIPNTSMKLLNVLEEHGLNYNLQDKKGLTPLMKLLNQESKTTKCGFFKIITPIDDPALIEIWNELMKKDSINLNLQDNREILIKFCFIWQSFIMQQRTKNMKFSLLCSIEKILILI